MRTSSLLAQLTSLPRISIQFLVTREPELLSPPAALSHSAANLSCMKMSLGESQHSLVTSNYSGPRGRLRARVRLSRHLTDRPCRSRGLFFGRRCPRCPGGNAGLLLRWFPPCHIFIVGRIFLPGPDIPAPSRWPVLHVVRDSG